MNIEFFKNVNLSTARIFEARDSLTWLLYCFWSSLYFLEESIKIKFWHEFKIVKIDVFYFSMEVSRHKVVSKNGLSL